MRDEERVDQRASQVLVENCEHFNFEVNAVVNRLEDTKQFQLDLTVKCSECNQPFRFLGLPFGLNLFGAAVGLDGTEARLAIEPHNEGRIKIAGFQEKSLRGSS